MKHKAIFTSCFGEKVIDKKTSPEFMELFSQSVLLSLLNENFINEVEFDICMDEIKNAHY